jgi:hypothetical protein
VVIFIDISDSVFVCISYHYTTYAFERVSLNKLRDNMGEASRDVTRLFRSHLIVCLGCALTVVPQHFSSTASCGH